MYIGYYNNKPNNLWNSMFLKSTTTSEKGFGAVIINDHQVSQSSISRGKNKQ